MAGCESQFIGMFVGIGAFFGLVGFFVFGLRAGLADTAHRLSSRGGLVGFLNRPARSRRFAGIYMGSFGILTMLIGASAVATGVWVGVTGAEVDCTQAAAAIATDP